MMVHYFDGGLNATLAAMRERIHQELSLSDNRGDRVITVRLAMPLLAGTPPRELQDGIAAMDLYLRGLPGVRPRLQRLRRGARHELEIATDTAEGPWLGKVGESFRNAWRIMNERSTLDLGEGETAATPGPAADASPPTASAGPVSGHNRFPLMHAALEQLARYLLQHVAHINEFAADPAGRQRGIVERVRFQARSDEARREYEAFFEGRDNANTWRGVLGHYLAQNGAGQGVSQVDLSDLRAFELAPAEAEAGEPDVMDILPGNGQSVQAFGMGVVWRYGPVEAERAGSPAPDAPALLRLEIRDARSPVVARLENAPSADFTAGREGEVAVQGSGKCSGRHLRFFHERNQWYAVDISRNGTLYGGVAMTRNTPQPLRVGDVFRFDALSPGNPAGDYVNRPEIRVAALLEPILTQPVEPPRASAIVTELTPVTSGAAPSGIVTQIDLPPPRLALWGGGTWQERPLPALPVLVGRSEACGLMVDGEHAAVSRLHMRIESVADDRVMVSVCPECRSGIYLDGRALPREGVHPVPFDQEFTLGPQDRPGHARACFRRGRVPS